MEHSWSDKCENPCSKPPQLSHGSFPAKCGGYSTTKDMVCTGQCDYGFKPSYPAPTAVCTSAGWVVKGKCQVSKGGRASS